MCVYLIYVFVRFLSHWPGTLLKMTTRWNTMTSRESQRGGRRERGDKDERERTRAIEQKERYAEHTHSCADSGSFGSACAALTLPFSMHLYCLTSVLVCECVCVCMVPTLGGNACVCIWCKALHCAQSGASILSQWARAKALNDPNLTWPLPLCHCVYSCACGWLLCSFVSAHHIYVCVNDTPGNRSTLQYLWPYSKFRHLHSHRKYTHASRQRAVFSAPNRQTCALRMTKDERERQSTTD